MQGYVYVNSNGVVNTLGMFAPIIISDGINIKTYEWETITAMSNAELAELNLYQVNISIPPPDGEQQIGVTYTFSNGVITENGIFAPIINK